MARRKNTVSEGVETTASPTAKRRGKGQADNAQEISGEIKSQYEAVGLEIKPISPEKGGGFEVVRPNGKTGRSKRVESLDICADVSTLENWINDYMVEQESSAAQDATVTQSQEILETEETIQEPQTEEIEAEAETPLTVAVAPTEPVPADDRSLQGWTEVVLNDPAPVPMESDPEWQHGIGVCPFAPESPGAWTVYRGSEIFMVDQSDEEGGGQWAVFVRFNEQGGWDRADWDAVPLIDTPDSFGEGQEKAIAVVDQWLAGTSEPEPEEVTSEETASANATAQDPEEEDIRPIQEIFTTSPESYDLQADLVSSEVLPFVNGEGMRWRLVRTRNYDRQRDIYMDAEGGMLYAAIGRLFWDGGIGEDGKPVVGLGQYQVSAPLDTGESTPELAPPPARRGRRRGSSSGNSQTPAAVAATPPDPEETDDFTPVAIPESIKQLIVTSSMDYYNPSSITETMPPEWAQAIAILESGGATIDQLNELLGVTQKPLYYSQNLGRYGKGIKKDGDRYVLV